MSTARLDTDVSGLIPGPRVRSGLEQAPVRTPGRDRVEPGWQPRWELPGPPVRESYLALAADYQRRATLFPGWREQLVARLALRRGDTVLDVCAGSGLNLAALRAAVGPEGTIIAIEESHQLLAVAADRVTRRRWDNVELINAPVETADLSVRADAALFAAATEVITAPAALANVFQHLHPGAPVAAGGWQYPSAWLWPLRALITVLHHPHLPDITGLDQPWRLLADYVPGLHVSEVGFGTGYLAHTPAPTPAHPPPDVGVPATAPPHRSPRHPDRRDPHPVPRMTAAEVCWARWNDAAAHIEHHNPTVPPTASPHRSPDQGQREGSDA